MSDGTDKFQIYFFENNIWECLTALMTYFMTYFMTKMTYFKEYVKKIPVDRYKAI